MAGQLVHVTISLSGDLVADTDSVSLTLRCRVQRVEKISRTAQKHLASPWHWTSEWPSSSTVTPAGSMQWNLTRG